MLMTGLLAEAVDKAQFALGGGLGIGRLADSAMAGIARQPEVGGRIFVNMIVAAALIEGFTFFAMVVCMTLIGKVMPA